jgi:hypothetical protein
MSRFRCRRRAAALMAPLLLAAFTARAGAPDNFFAALDAAALVAVCQIEQVDQPAGSRLVIFHARTRDVLKGSMPAPPSSLSIVQELLFPSDAPAVATGASGLCVLKPMPQYSAYRTLLTAGPYYRFANPEMPLMEASLAAVTRQWLALQQLSPADERATKRVRWLLDHAGDARLGKDALAELGATADLGALLERVGYDRIGTLVRDTRIPLEQRRALLTLLADHHLTAALPVLLSVPDAGLAPFLHQTIVALGGSVPMAQLQSDLKADADDQRLAGVDALGTAAARSHEEKMRQDAMATLARLAVHDGSAAVRLAAVDQLGKMGGEALPAIEPLLAQPDTHLVYAAGRALGAIGSPAATRMLAQQFKQGSYDAQVAAVFGLREIATPEALRVLADVKANPPDPRLPRVIDLATGKEPGHK